ncbi:MAG: hypothetical protein U1C96_11025 [Gallionella sp.]|nr:hypothetical protein [Gallionella sp.]
MVTNLLPETLATTIMPKTAKIPDKETAVMDPAIPGRATKMNLVPITAMVMATRLPPAIPTRTTMPKM